MKSKKSIFLLSILLVSLISISGCSSQSPQLVFHGKSTFVDQTKSSWSEPVSVKKGQTIEVDYTLKISKGIWSIWLTRSGETAPRYYYSAYDSDYKGSIKFTVPEAGKYVLHLKSKNITGSHDVTMRVIK